MKYDFFKNSWQSWKYDKFLHVEGFQANTLKVLELLTILIMKF